MSEQNQRQYVRTSECVDCGATFQDPHYIRCPKCRQELDDWYGDGPTLTIYDARGRTVLRGGEW